jgi:alpha-ketoglutarate-dependent taurine dioxygenase
MCFKEMVTFMTGFRAVSCVVPGQQHYGQSVFPFVYQPASDLSADIMQMEEWVAEQRDHLLSLATQHGAILFRGFPLSTAEDFDRFLAALRIENFPYQRSLSNAVRINYTERVFSANEAPPAVKILLHHEMAQTPLFPANILFFCEIAAEQGGATPVCRSDILFERLQAELPQFVSDLECKGLKYSNVMPGVNDPNSGMGRSWQSTLGVETKEQAESRLRELGYTWQWLDQDCLRATTPILPAIREIAPGRKTLFNQLIAAYAGWSDLRNDPSNAIRHGDESKLDAEAVARLIELADELSFDMAWQAGDAVLIDNTVAMHGRRPFVGKRKVLASLGNMHTHAFRPAT